MLSQFDITWRHLGSHSTIGGLSSDVGISWRGTQQFQTGCLNATQRKWLDLNIDSRNKQSEIIRFLVEFDE